VVNPLAGHEAASPVTSGAEVAVGAAVVELDQEAGVTTAETAVGIEISEIEEMIRHRFGTSVVGSVMSTGDARGTVSVADEHLQARDGRLPAETSENANWQSGLTASDEVQEMAGPLVQGLPRPTLHLLRSPIGVAIAAAVLSAVEETGTAVEGVHS